MSTYLAEQIREIADHPTVAGLKTLRRLALQVERMETTLDEIVAIDHLAERMRSVRRRPRSADNAAQLAP